MWESESESLGGREYRNGVLDSSRHSVKTDGFERRDNSWYVETEIPSDLLVQVGHVSFHLHKYPLLSRSGRMNRIIYESRDMDLNKVVLDDLPGGPDAFELASKFCYGIAVDLTVTNISGLRCAAEYLEMTEDLEEGNLIFKTEAFLSYIVLSSWRDSILVLKSCEKLTPWAENLQVIRRCSESIAWKACANPRGIRWDYTGKNLNPSSPKWKEMKESSPGRNQVPVPSDWWFEDVSILRIDHFVKVVTAIKVKGMRFELIGAAIMHYAAKWLPAFTKGIEDEESSNEYSSTWKGGLHLIVSGSKEDPPNVQIREQQMITESLISIIPPQKDSVSCSFLLQLLRMVNMLKAAPALVTELEKRAGMQLEQATLGDLLIPSYNKSDTLYDTDLVQRLLEHFLVQEQTVPLSPSRQSSLSDKHTYEGSLRANVPNAKIRVAKLVDSYLTEVSRDRNLSLTKFQVLAEALPESARTCDDGLYRAVDSYLKAHPTLSEHERKRLCRVMDCQKLSVDACMHAAQNERLPLRVVVQVLFSEQVKISNAIANNSQKESSESLYLPMISNRKPLLEGTPQCFQEGWVTAKKDINTLKFEIESMKGKYLKLQNEMENFQRQFDKMSKQKHSSAWSSGWKKLSKLTKMTASDTQDIGSQNLAMPDPKRKTPRRWRNSIS